MIDSHCHIHGDGFEADRAAVLERARAAGITAMLTVGTDLTDSRAAAALAKGVPEVYAALGIHPQAAETYGPDDVKALAALQGPKVIAVGETGYDLHYTPESFERQRELFRAHVALAAELELPLIIHDREAHAQTLELLDELAAWQLGGVLHCFSGDAAMAAYAVERGYYISVPGVVTFKNSAVLREALTVVPLENLLIETDCPYLAPVPRRGKRNEPAYLGFTLATLAELKGLTVQRLEQITTLNFNRLFKNALL